MRRLGIPVPPGFTVSTTAARAFMEHRRLPERLGPQMMREMAKLELETGKGFGDPDNPLLVSVRSGAEVSMPGMMDTVLNLGLNPETVKGLAEQTGSERFAFDCYRRFLAMFGSVVLKVDREVFEAPLKALKERRMVESDADLKAEDLRALCDVYREAICEGTGLSSPPDDPWEQLAMATVAVFQSWNNERAQLYRKAHLIPDAKGTAVTVQAMVFGNRGNDSGTGVVFSSNVSTGEAGIYGEFLVNAQGEDVVAGIRTPLPIDRMSRWNPSLFTQLQTVVGALERHYGDTVDVEFTVENGVLYILQARVAKRTREAEAKEVFRMVRNIKDPHKRAEAIRKALSAEALVATTHASFDPDALAEAAPQIIARGLPVSPGVAVGKVALSSAEAQWMAGRGEQVILVRPDTSPDDLPGMMAARAIVTETGGATSHAAVVARGMNKPAIAGASALSVLEGQTISIDGSSGIVYRGPLPIVQVDATKETMLLGKWLREGERQDAAPPRLDFEMIDAGFSFNALCNDFYLVDAIAQASRGTSLGQEAALLKRKIHENTARLIATYLLLAVVGELRHQSMVKYSNQRFAHDSFEDGSYGDDDYAVREAWELELAKEARNELWSSFGMLEMNDRETLQDRMAKALASRPLADQIRFLDLVQTVFEKARWVSSYGGPAWGGIASAAKKYLSGQIGPTEFVDHAFDLQHNNGSVFGKRDIMLSGDRNILQQQLERKKHAKNLDQLTLELRREYPVASPEVQRLLQKGVLMRLWNRTWI